MSGKRYPEEFKTEAVKRWGNPTDGHKGVQQLAVQLNETWKAVASRFEGNAEVHLCHDGKYPSLTISSLEKLEEPPSLHRLNSRVSVATCVYKWPNLHLSHFFSPH